MGCSYCLILGGWDLHLRLGIRSAWLYKEVDTFPSKCILSWLYLLITNSGCASSWQILQESLRPVPVKWLKWNNHGMIRNLQRHVHSNCRFQWGFLQLSLLASLSNMKLWTNDPMASPRQSIQCQWLKQSQHNKTSDFCSFSSNGLVKVKWYHFRWFRVPLF